MELSLLLCDDLDGGMGEVGGRLRREGIYVCVTDSLLVQQKLTQYCKAIIL